MSSILGQLTKPGQTPAMFAQGADAVLVRFDVTLSDAANRAAIAFAGHLSAHPPDHVVEVASALVSVLVRFDPANATHQSVAAALVPILAERGGSSAALPDHRTRWHVPTAFGGAHGPALPYIAAEAGVSPDQAVADITGTDLRVLALGFAPGQPYLGFLPPAYDLPRQTDLTPQVPASSIVLAIRQIVLFANAAPTGWRQIGQTHLPCCRPDAARPILLQAGDEIRFHAVGHGEFDTLATHELGGVRAEAIT